MNDEPAGGRWMRDELLNILRTLCDTDFQRNCWVARKCPLGAEYDNVHIPLSFLLDDTSFLRNPEDEIGNSVDNLEQALAVQAVSLILHDVITEIGDRERDEAYLNARSWPKVISSAQVALDTFGPMHRT